MKSVGNVGHLGGDPGESCWHHFATLFKIVAGRENVLGTLETLSGGPGAIARDHSMSVGSGVRVSYAGASQ